MIPNYLKRGPAIRARLQSCPNTSKKTGLLPLRSCRTSEERLTRPDDAPLCPSSASAVPSGLQNVSGLSRCGKLCSDEFLFRKLFSPASANLCDNLRHTRHTQTPASRLKRWRNGNYAGREKRGRGLCFVLAATGRGPTPAVTRIPSIRQNRTSKIISAPISRSAPCDPTERPSPPHRKSAFPSNAPSIPRTCAVSRLNLPDNSPTASGKRCPGSCKCRSMLAIAC